MNIDNFRVECTYGLGNGTFTTGKIYNVTDGKIFFDDGVVFENNNTIDVLNDRFSANFRLLDMNLSCITDDALIAEVHKRRLTI